MDPIKEALTFDDVTLAPKYSEILPSEVDTSIKLTENLKLKIPLLSSAMDTVTESKMAIAIAKAGGIGVIHRNLDVKKQIAEIKKVKQKKLLVGAAVGAGPNELERAKQILKEGVDLIVVDTAHGHTKKVSEIVKLIKKIKSKKTALMCRKYSNTRGCKIFIKFRCRCYKSRYRSWFNLYNKISCWNRCTAIKCNSVC
jgi:IMP dehydrogenase